MSQSGAHHLSGGNHVGDRQRSEGEPQGPPELSDRFQTAGGGVLACAPNVSVSKLAAKHGINANMVFKWRRQYRASYFGVPGTGPRTSPVTLIPVVTPAVSEHHASTRPSEAVIEVVMGDVTLRLCGGVDPITLNTVLDCLARQR